MDHLKEIPQFKSLVLSFYSNDPKDKALYPIATPQRIHQAINTYLESKPLGAIQYDSFDREKVREIIQPGYSIF